MAGRPRGKLAHVKAAMRAGDWQKALRIAARFPRLGTHRAAIVRAHEAYSNPRFYFQLGYDLTELKAAGRLALISRFGR